jgi:GGDEF domain-containing protein
VTPADVGELSRLEQSMLSLVRKRGVMGYVLWCTAMVVLGSETLMIAVLLLTDGFSQPEFWQQALLWSGLIPLLVAPLALHFTARLVEHLDRTRTILRSWASTDVLTGIANRRGFFDGVAELVESTPQGTTFEVGMLDLDRFKSLNDRFGHARGDDALVLVARWLRSTIGDAGVVGRIGGDEFTYVVPLASVGVPDRMHFDLDGIDVEVTVGRVCSRLDGGIDSVLATADQVLYRNKQNRLTVESLTALRTSSDRLDAGRDV